jgi:DNA-binding IclR family transcriptional regulator
VWDGEAPVVVRVDDNSSRLVRIVVATGSRLPRDSAQGQIFRAFMERPGTDPQLDRIREARLTYYSAVVEGIAAHAAPVFQGEEIVATIALVGTTSSVEADGDMAALLRDAAENLSTELGFVEPERRRP